PFGAYETNLVSDPLTLEIGETRETATLLGFAYAGIGASVYGFNGGHEPHGDNRIGSWGVNLRYAWEQGAVAVAVSAGWINNLGDSDSLQDTLADNRAATLTERLAGEAPRGDGFSTDPTERTAGWTANLRVAIGPVSVIGEYLSAADRFDPDSLSYKGAGAEPSAWNLELGYGFAVFGKDTVAAVAYQGTDEAVGLELPKASWLIGWSIGIFDNTALSFEYRNDRDYSEGKGGTGDDGNSFLAQLAVEF
ncbi:LbtU family siderophore porin, partial [uncultured Thiohalocapsa sp.]|uniref:LbtU family siderophore porin n=1 Tax=uncultured Thiohalocapsa sp. TaxID=768990 RepID=UPI0025CF083B